MPGTGFLNNDMDLSTFLLLGFLSFFGVRLVQRQPAIRDMGKRIAVGMFFSFTLILVVNRQPADATGWLAILFRALIFAGIVQGAAWTILPAAFLVHRNTFGLASSAIKRRAKEVQAERDRQFSALRDREFQEQEAIRRSQREREREADNKKKLQNERIRLDHEHEQEFYRLREEAVGLFLKHHALLEKEFSVAAIVDDFEKKRSAIRDSWNDVLRFAHGWQYQILIGAARNNLVNDYVRVEPVIGLAFPRDQFQLLVNEALDRDGGSHDVGACMQRLDSLHDQIVMLFEHRVPEWQTNADAIRAESYAKVFAESEDAREEENPFDDEGDRLTHQGDVG